MAELVVEELSKSFGGVRVLGGVSFTVPHGGFTIVLGPSGCGKSTLLRVVAGLEEPDGGEVRLGGRSVLGLAPRQRDVAMVFQSYALYPHLSVRDNLAFPLRMRKAPQEDITRRVGEAARLLGLEELLDRRPRQLSGGQRQRVAIGRALVRAPALFLFDEPLSNLDARLRAEMRVELARLHRRLGTTMVYVTHDQVEAMTLGRHIVVLHQGVVQQEGTPQEVYQRPANLFVAGFIGTPEINLVPGVVEAGRQGVWLRAGEKGEEMRLPLPTVPAEWAGRELVVGIRPEDLRPGRGRLQARLELAERLGGESVLHLRRGGVSLRARAPADFPARPGELVPLEADPARFHYFAGQRRVEPAG